MDEALLDQLLREGEGNHLDYKREVAFVGATDEQKSKLLKDILAFANAWGDRDRHILVGVDHTPGKPATVVGITSGLDDSQIQQFVNSKTNRPRNVRKLNPGRHFVVDSERVSAALACRGVVRLPPAGAARGP